MNTVSTAEGEQLAAKIKSQLSEQVRKMMKRRNMSQSELARRMRTSRAVVHRLLCPTETSVTLSTISRAAAALSVRMRIKLVA